LAQLLRNTETAEKEIRHRPTQTDTDYTKKGNYYTKDFEWKDMEENNSVMILTFLLSGEKFGLEISNVLEVNRLPEILPVHGTEGSIIGLINLHGKSAPVVALDRLLNLRSEETEKRLFVALRTREGPLCFLVDELVGFEEITEDEIKKFEDMTSKFDASYLQFVCVRSDSMIPVLDVNYLTEIRGENDESASANNPTQQIR